MEHAPLVYALVHALDRAITGEMVFREPTGEAHTVTFFEGAPVRVEPGHDGERIGEDLVAMDYLREDSLARALLTAQTSRRRLGEILVQAEAVDPDVLTEALTLQTSRRLARLANLSPQSTFSLYFSARADPEPFAPWAPLDTLLATVRAWTDRSRLHGTLRWLSKRPLALSADSDLDNLMLTSREQAAVALMHAEIPSLKDLYARVGNGLSSLLYVLAVTRQFTFTEEKGAPLGIRKASDLVGDLVQVAVPIAAVIAPGPSEGELEGAFEDHGSVPPPDAPAAPAAQPARVSVPVDAASPPPAAPARPASAAADPPPPHAPHLPATAAAPPPAEPQPAPPRSPPRPSYSPAKATGAGSADEMALSAEFHRAEEAVKLHDFETADRLLRERCTEADTATPDFQALAAWIKANLLSGDAGAALNDLTFLLMSHHTCQTALYYRGLLLKRAGKEKAALRDFVLLAKENPGHTGALTEIKQLRDSMKV